MDDTNNYTVGIHELFQMFMIFGTIIPNTIPYLYFFLSTNLFARVGRKSIIALNTYVDNLWHRRNLGEKGGRGTELV